MLTIVDSACTIEPDCSKAVIVLESDCDQPRFSQAHEELSSLGARQDAIVAAIKKGLARASLNATPVVFPVNLKGVPLDEVRGADGAPLPFDHQEMQPYRYRVAVKLINGPR